MPKQRRGFGEADEGEDKELDPNQGPWIGNDGGHHSRIDDIQDGYSCRLRLKEGEQGMAKSFPPTGGWRLGQSRRHSKALARDGIIHFRSSEDPRHCIIIRSTFERAMLFSEIPSCQVHHTKNVRSRD